MFLKKEKKKKINSKNPSLQIPLRDQETSSLSSFIEQI